MSTHRYTQANVARIPAEAIERGEDPRATQLRALLQGLAQTLLNFTENGDPEVTAQLEAMLHGAGGFKIGSGSHENGVWLTVSTVGNPVSGMQEIVPLNNGRSLKRGEIAARLPDLLREAGIDPDKLGQIEKEEILDDIFGKYADLDQVELDQMEA